MTNREPSLRSYLLGDMPEAERVALEREYFADPLLFEQLVQTENELVDAYARGLLESETRALFERHYLAHPSRRARARFAGALAAALEGREAHPRAATARAEPSWRRLLASFRGPKLAWALSASLLLVGAAAAWLFTGRGESSRESARAGVERATPQQNVGESQRQAGDVGQVAGGPTPDPDTPHVRRKAAPPSPTPGAKAAPVVATLLLTAGGTRGAESGSPATVLLTARTEQVRLRLNLSETNYRNYGGVLRRAGGSEVFSWRRVPARAAKSGGSVSLVIPARRLTEGDYILTLRGTRDTGETEDVSVSLFRVERR